MAQSVSHDAHDEAPAPKRSALAAALELPHRRPRAMPAGAAGGVVRAPSRAAAYVGYVFNAVL